MKEKWLMIGIIATFGAFFLMMVSMMILSRQSAKNKELLAQAPSTPQQTQTVPTATADFSPYKTIVGDDGREMVEIPHNRFIGDRKSTRLNSSHGYISYAVFCLKKKKLY